jgi:DNA polymerase-3 subunit alpha
MGRDTPLKWCLEEHPGHIDGYKAAKDLREMCAADPDVKEVVDVALRLEGLRRQDGIHAAAVVITKEPLTEYLPIQRKPDPGQDADAAPIVTQYEMHGVEDLGLLKMDFLGLRNLDVITDTVELVRATRDPTFDIDAVPLDDAAVFELLSQGDTLAVFQLESTPMRALLRALAPTSFEDVSAVLALYRPGPMSVNMHYDYADRKNGRKPVTYIHPDAEDVLADTYGLMIYQESVMRMSQRFAGYSLADADNLRKACGKKIRSLMAQERGKFEDGCEATGYGRDLGRQLFDIIEGFADYAFTKSHTFGYGLITYQTAYLKAHYPVEYLACLLSSVKTSLERAAVYLADCRAMGIKVLNPDVNLSASDFTALPPERAPAGVQLPKGCPGVIPFGLSAVRNVGEGLVALIVEERERGGPFVSFYDFVERVDPAVLNKRSVESLIKGGAFDTLGHPRKGLLQVFEQIIDATLQRRRERDQGVMSLFGGGDGLDDAFSERVAIPDVEFDKVQRLRFEKEMLGLYVSDHPLMGVEGALRRRADATIADLESREEGDVLTLGGVVTSLQRKFTKKGDPMGVFILEDLQDAVEVTLFPRAMVEHGYKLSEDAIVLVKGRVDKRDEAAKLICIEISVFEGHASSAPALRLNLPALSLSDDRIGRLKQMLAEHPGESPVYLHLGEGKVLRLPDEHRVDLARVVGELRVAFGHEAVIL